MKVFIVCSKRFYNRVPSIRADLESSGHEVTLPNSFDDPGAEERHKKTSKEVHAKWKMSMLSRSMKIIESSDAILVLNFEKDGQPNYIGGATFLEMYDAYRYGRKIYLYNDIPSGMLNDEISGLEPKVLKGDLSLLHGADVSQ